MLKKIPDWIPIGIEGKHSHTLFDLMKEVATDLRSGGTLDLTGCPAVRDQLLETIPIGMYTIDPAWAPPPPTEVMASI